MVPKVLYVSSTNWYPWQSSVNTPTVNFYFYQHIIVVAPHQPILQHLTMEPVAQERTLAFIDTVADNVALYRDKRQRELEDFVESVLYPVTCCAIQNISREEGAVRMTVIPPHWSVLLAQAKADDKIMQIHAANLREHEGTTKHSQCDGSIKRGVLDILADMMKRDGFEVEIDVSGCEVCRAYNNPIQHHYRLEIGWRHRVHEKKGQDTVHVQLPTVDVSKDPLLGRNNTTHSPSLLDRVWSTWHSFAGVQCTSSPSTHHV